MFVVVVALFYLLTPGILLVLPPKSSKYIVAFTHAVVFAIVWTLIHKPLWMWSQTIMREGMVANKKKPQSANDIIKKAMASVK
jgi:hypothetical protein